MDMCNRIANQSAIDYFAQIKRNQPLDDADCLETEGKKKGKSSTKAWVLGAFHSTSKLPGKNSASLVPLPKTSAATTVDPARPLPKTAQVNGAEPSIHFDEYRIHIRDDRFKFCLVGKFPQSRPSLEHIKEWAAREWKLEGNCWITLLDQSHVFIRLENEGDMIHVWPRNQCFVEGHVMKVFKWTPTFRPSDGEPSSAAVWISFPSLPVVFYEQDLLYPIASKVGKVLGMDDDTRNLTRTTFARVCLEVDLLKKAPRRIWIGVGKGGFWQRIEYEDLPNYCSICCMIGHTTTLCSRNNGNIIVDRSEEKGPSCSFMNFHAKVGCRHTHPLLNRCMLVHSVQSKVEKDPKRKEVEIVGEQRHSANGINNEVGNNQDLIGCNLRQDSTNDGIDVSKQVRSLGNGAEKVKFHTEVKQKNLHDIEEELHDVEEQDDSDNGLGNRKSKFRKNKEHNQAKGIHEDETNIKNQGKQSNSIRSYFRVRHPIWKHPKKTLGEDTAESCTKGSFPLQIAISESGTMDSVRQPQILVPNPCRHISFTEIKSATRNFQGDRLIGEGGFGEVYKGVLRGGAIVAIKRYKAQCSSQGASEFRTEIELLSRLSCRHLATLIGYCNENDEMILVYEFISGGDLGKHLFRNHNRHPLSWTQRLRICIGAARGLHYLHTNGVIHRDVKSSNILIDDDWGAKLTDLGISRLGDTEGKTHVSTRVMGTPGYAEPQYVATGHLTYQSDVYSFGIVMLEVLFGRHNIERERRGQSNLDKWLKSCRRKKILQANIDSCLKDSVSPECLEKFAALSTKCLSKSRSDRPGMGDVVGSLEVILQLQQDHDTPKQKKTTRTNAASISSG